jgi:hypothetical protein
VISPGIGGLGRTPPRCRRSRRCAWNQTAAFGHRRWGSRQLPRRPGGILIASSLRSRDFHATAESHGGDRGASLIIEVAPVFGIAWQRTGKNGGEPRKSTLGLSIAAWGRETTPPRRRLLAISGGSIAGFIGFGPTDESTGIRVAVPALALCSDRCRSEGSTKRRYLWGNAVEPVLRLGRSKVKHRAIEPERRPQRRQGRPRLRRLRASSEMALAIPIAVMVITLVPAIVAAVPAAMVITAMIIAVPPAPCLGFV